MIKVSIHTDGGARGNPGPAGIGVVIADEAGKTVKTVHKYIGEATNNQAEYEAVWVGLQAAKEFNAREVDFFLDSELVVEQMNRNYKIKNEALGKMFIKIWNLSQDFSRVTYTHVPRERNKLADQLVNQAIDEHLSKH